MQNYYPDTLKVIVAMIEGLNEIDKKIDEITKGLDFVDGPYFSKVPITDRYGTDYGELIDEIGGAWSWQVPERDIEQVQKALLKAYSERGDYEALYDAAMNFFTPEQWREFEDTPDFQEINERMKSNAG